VIGARRGANRGLSGAWTSDRRARRRPDRPSRRDGEQSSILSLGNIVNILSILSILSILNTDQTDQTDLPFREKSFHLVEKPLDLLAQKSIMDADVA